MAFTPIYSILATISCLPAAASVNWWFGTGVDEKMDEAPFPSLSRSMKLEASACWKVKVP